MTTHPEFPTTRLRRLRYHPALRQIVAATRISPQQLILPLFVREGENIRQAISSMPGHFQLSVDQLEKELNEIVELGLGGVILFGIPAQKDATGSDAVSDDGIIQQALREIRRVTPELLVISDVCFCEYTDHGHCGVVNDRTGRMDVDNEDRKSTRLNSRNW